MLVQSVPFINAEPGAIQSPVGLVPVVVLSFGGIEGPVEDKAVSIPDARNVVVEVIESLASHGDETAMAIYQQFFAPSEHRGECGEGGDSGQ